MSDDTLVLTRFRGDPIFDTPEAEQDGRLLGMFVDVETTGLDPQTCSVIQLAILPFMFDKTGRVLCTLEPLVWLEQPEEPIPEEITALTGITNEMVEGKRIAGREVENLVTNAALVIAHNAEFDRPVLERRLSIFTRLRWGCSMQDVPWAKFGYCAGQFVRLEWLMFKHLRMFYDGHNAAIDTQAAVSLLASKLGDMPALSYVLAAAKKKWRRLSACGAPYETRHILKQRGYRWSDGSKHRPKAWWIDVADDDVGAEITWLAENVYENRDIRPIMIDEFDARLRFSERIGR